MEVKLMPRHHHHHHHEIDHVTHRFFPVRAIKELLLLSIIREKPIHGSEIYRVLRDRYGLDVPKPIIYMLLRRMEERGLIISEWEMSERGPVKRIYRITEEGLDYLNDSVERLRKLRDIINDILSKLTSEE